MASIINAATSGGLISTADTSGILQLQTAGTTAVTVDASQRLLAGPSVNLSGARLQVQGATDTAFTALTVNATTNDGYMGIGYSSSGSVWQIWPTYAFTAGYKPLAFVVGGSEVARFPTASGFQCVNSISVGNATPTTSGAGITFPATQSASTDANTLDDYEEGSWTPTLTASTTAPTSVSYADQTARYTKVGRVVTVTMFLQINNRTGGSGNTRIAGLPFTSQNVGAAVLGSIYLGLVNWGASRTALYCSVAQNDTYINIGALGTNLDPTGIAITEFNNTDDYVGITVTYFV